MSLSPSPPPPDTSAALTSSTTLTFKLPSRRSSTLLADGGLADLYKIFGVRASMTAARDGGDLVAVTLTGSNYYAALARHWVIARVAPEYAMKLRLSPAQLYAILGAKLQSLVALQLHSCCYAAELPRGSGNLLLQGANHAVQRAIQWIAGVASAKHLNINFDAGDAYATTGYHGRDSSPPRSLTPFHTHAIKLFPPSSPSSAVASSSESSNCAGAASPATFGPTLSRVFRNKPSTSSSPQGLPVLKVASQQKCFPAPIIIDGESVALAHGKGYFFSTRGLQLVYDWFARRGHDCIIVTRTSRIHLPSLPTTTCANLSSHHHVTFFPQCAVPDRLHAHPNNQRPPLIDSDVLQSLNTSGALVTDTDPVSRIIALAERCKSRDRSAVVISNNNALITSCRSPSEFFVLSFHISGSSFVVLPKHQSNAYGPIDSILSPSRSQSRLSVFASSPIVVSSKRKPTTPLLTPKSGLSGTGGNLQGNTTASMQNPPHRSSSSCKIKATVHQTAISVLPISFGKDALDLVCDPSVWY